MRLGTAPTLLSIAALVLLSGPPAQAHLAIVRQGEASADVPADGERIGQVLAAGDFDQERWDGRDDTARPVASGGYWLTMEGRGERRSRSALPLK